MIQKKKRTVITGNDLPPVSGCFKDANRPVKPAPPHEEVQIAPDPPPAENSPKRAFLDKVADAFAFSPPPMPCCIFGPRRLRT